MKRPRPKLREKQHPHWPAKYRFLPIDTIAEIEGVSRRTLVYWAKNGWPSRDPDRNPHVGG